ncbi:MAG: ATP12 family chaperone protein [Hyphomicrobiaceae bacterium]
MYTAASAAAVDGGYAIQLDGRNVRTPARALLVVPREILAEAVVAEWNAQGEHIEHQSMPMTRFANTALDNVRGRELEIIDEITAFAASDLICYRAETPRGLVAAQQASWDCVLAWVEETFDARFVPVAGVMHTPQPAPGLAVVREAVAGYDGFALTGLHNMTTLTGSALLALACAHGHIGPEETWERAHVDEDWQISQWGSDAEAAARRVHRGEEFAAAYRFLKLRVG